MLSIGMRLLVRTAEKQTHLYVYFIFHFISLVAKYSPQLQAMLIVAQ